MKSPIDKDSLLKYFHDLDELLGKEKATASIYCVGGTALILMDVKEASMDLDFTTRPEDYNVIDRLRKQIEQKHGVIADHFLDGRLTYTELPADYAERAKPVLGGVFHNIRLFVLDVPDIVLSKLTAFREKDIGDVEDLLAHEGQMDRASLEQRFEAYHIIPEEGKQKVKERLERFFLSHRKYFP